MTGVREMNIAGYEVGDSTPPFVVAEAGVHHYNSVELAKQLILEARVAGVDAIKFQTYTAKRIAAKWAPTYWDAPKGQTQFDIFSERSLLTKTDYAVLFRYAQELGLILLSTPFDPDSASLLAEFDMPAYKIASADITYFPLLETIASFKKPMLLSTGAATFEEISKTVEYLRGLGVQFALLHCVLSYPTPVKDANLRRIVELRERFPDCVIGYSDHTQPQDSMLACPLAVGLGARIVEKHFTLNKHLDGDDHYHAVDAIGLRQIVRDCKDAVIMTREGKEMMESEKPARTYARRSIVAARPLKAGTIISMEDIDFKRPGTGISPTVVDTVLGKTLLCDLAADALIQYEHLS